MGRPTFLEQYRTELWEAAQSGTPFVPDLQPEMPEGWRPGQPLLRTCEPAILGSEDEEEPLRQPPRKTRKKLPAEAKSFVREYVQIQTCRKGWSTCAPFRQICSSSAGPDVLVAATAEPVAKPDVSIVSKFVALRGVYGRGAQVNCLLPARWR